MLEFLLGKYCASSDEMAIQMGLQVVNDTLANNYIRPDESMKAQSKVKESGRYTFIDKVKVRLVDSDYWAEVVNFGNKFVHIPTHYVRDYERLLTGGIWAQLDMRFEYDEEAKGKNPFWIDKLTPIQIATFDLDEYRRVRAEFTDRRVDRPDRAEHGLRAGGDVAPAQAALPGAAHPARRAQLQPRRARVRAAPARATSCRRSRPTPRCSRARPRSPTCSGTWAGARRAWCRSGTSSASTRSPTCRRCRRKSSRR